MLLRPVDDLDVIIVPFCRALPNITSVQHCYLEMLDDFGHKMASPAFAFRRK